MTAAAEVNLFSAIIYIKKKKNVGAFALLRYHIPSVNCSFVCVCVCISLFVSTISSQIISHSSAAVFLVLQFHVNSSTGFNGRLLTCRSIDGACCCCFPVNGLTFWKTFLQGCCENDFIRRRLLPMKAVTNSTASKTTQHTHTATLAENVRGKKTGHIHSHSVYYK